MRKVALTVNDTADAISVGRTTIYQLIKNGRLDTFRVGRRTLITMESIERLMKSA